jgi:predicted Zn-dependent protease
LADGSKVPAVQGLLSTAERERRAGRLESAAAALERAQRLAPQSALVYQRLAEVRLQQKRPAEAEHLARKGVGFASGAGMQAALWRLIAEARRQQGRLPAADEAAARAAALEEHATDAL